MYENLAFRRDGSIFRLKVESLVVIEASENYVRCFYFEGSALVRTTFQNLLAKLPPGKFMQISRIHAVRISEVEKFSKEELYLIGLPERTFGVGKQYYEGMLAQFEMLE